MKTLLTFTLFALLFTNCRRCETCYYMDTVYTYNEDGSLYHEHFILSNPNEECGRLSIKDRESWVFPPHMTYHSNGNIHVLTETSIICKKE